MRYLEIRRHSQVKKGSPRLKGSDLSLQGVALARRVGDGLGPFERVFTSPVPRTIETALAMGYAVTETLDVLGDVPTELLEQLGHHERWSGQNPFATLRQHFAADGSTRRLGLVQRDAWLSIAKDLPDSASALIISHGMVIEAGLVAAMATADLAQEPPFGYCEGVRLAFDGNELSSPELLRVDGSVLSVLP